MFPDTQGKDKERKCIREMFLEMHAAVIIAKCFQARNEHFHPGNLKVFVYLFVGVLSPVSY